MSLAMAVEKRWDARFAVGKCQFESRSKVNTIKQVSVAYIIKLPGPCENMKQSICL